MERSSLMRERGTERGRDLYTPVRYGNIEREDEGEREGGREGGRARERESDREKERERAPFINKPIPVRDIKTFMNRS